MIALLRQVADPGNSEARNGRHAYPPHCERDADRARRFLQAQCGMADKITRLQHAIFGSASKKEKVINWVTASRFGSTDATRRLLAHRRSLHAGYLTSSKAKAWFEVFP